MSDVDPPAGHAPATPQSTLRALVEAIIPQDDTIGAGDIHAESFVEHYLEFLQPGLTALLAASLDGCAAAIAMIPFAAGLFEAADIPARLAALRALGTHDVPELRDLGDVVVALSVAAFYGEWTGLDDAGRLAGVPVGWELTGYAGPQIVNALLSR